MPLTLAQKQIIKASIPFLEENGVELTAKMYSYMLSTYPEVRPFFNKSHQITKRQPKILAFSLVAYAKNIDDITPLTPFIRQIVEKHVGLSVQKEHYNIVGVSLLKTLKDVVGEAASEEFMKAWEVAYFDLANALIGLEKDRYDTELKIENAWLGFKDAKIDNIVQESENVKSIYIKADDSKYAKFYPGQYITIRISTDGGETVQSREYSLSNEFTEIDGLDHYRISVRRIPNGVVSNHVHDNLKIGDEIKISSPYGKLLEPYINALNEESSPVTKKPATFFIGGIGITPSISSIEYFLHQGNPVKLLLSNNDLKTRAFGEWLQKLLSTYKETFNVEEFITELDQESSLPITSSNYKVHNRRVNANDLAFISEENANNNNYYLIGPIEYMKLITDTLTSKGVSAGDINSEQYGPIAV